MNITLSMITMITMIRMITMLAIMITVMTITMMVMMTVYIYWVLRSAELPTPSCVSICGEIHRPPAHHVIPCDAL
jgi:hypothetical protein